MPKVFLDFATTGSELPVSRDFDSDLSSAGAATGVSSRFASFTFTSVVESSLVSSSLAGIGVVISKGLSATSVAGVGAAAVSAPGDGVRGGSLTVALGELMDC